MDKEGYKRIIDMQFQVADILRLLYYIDVCSSYVPNKTMKQNFANFRKTVIRLYEYKGKQIENLRKQLGIKNA